MRFIGSVIEKLQRHPKRIVFPEGAEPRVLQAARQFCSLRLGVPFLLGDRARVKEAADALRKSVVAKAERSPAAVAKQTTGRTPDGLPIHSFQTLIADLATLTKNTVEIATAPGAPFTITARPTPIQKKALDLLDSARTQ